MIVSEQGLNLIKQFEGCSLTSYEDIAGVWTIGYGHTGPDVTEGQTITQKQADKLLADDLQYFEKVVSDLVKVDLNQSEFDALVSFAYNVGPSALKTSTLLGLLNNGQSRSIVALQFLRWNKVDGKEVEGLTRRRKAEMSLFLAEPIPTSVATFIKAKEDTWLKRRPGQSVDLPAEEKLFVPRNSAYIFSCITIIAGETDYKVMLEAQPNSDWWFYPPHWTIINEPKKVTPELKPKPQKPTGNILLNVPYYSQRDNYVDPLRTCFSSSCAMMLKFLKPNSINNDDDYLKVVNQYGDTTEAHVQLKALKSFGVDAGFVQNAAWEDLDAQLERGIPIPIGILHKGPVTAPTGGGHWITVIGKSKDGNGYIVNDPYGELDLVSGTYINTKGGGLTYSKKNLGSRWLVEGPKSGWMIRGSK